MTTPGTAPDDRPADLPTGAPISLPSRTLDAVAEASARLLRTVQRMSPEQVFEPSALPGWTRGHVLTHIARNADALGNLLRGARLGERIPMYPSPEAREHDIEQGAKRPLAEQLADLGTSTLELATAAATMPTAAWSFEVPHRTGPFPAAVVADKRYAEIEYHHVDLGLDYTPAHWPADFVAYQLAQLTSRYSGAEELRPLLLLDTDTEARYRLGSGAAEPLALAGPGTALVAWLSGRSDGSVLTGASPAGSAPAGSAPDGTSDTLPTLPPLA
jgi:maleylpyruvate isomerase